METRPRVSTFVSSLVNYENTIPANADPDAKPAAPAARMGKFSSYRNKNKKIKILFIFGVLALEQK